MIVRLVAYTPNPEVVAGTAAATCTDSKSPEKSLKSAMKSGHNSVLEHASFSFSVEDVSRVTLAQLTRHRIASFSVKSQRYCNTGKDAMMVVPGSVRKEGYEEKGIGMFKSCVDFNEELVASGVPKEDARYFLPEGVCTKIMLTMNARELLHFFRLRTCHKAQWEIREMAEKMLTEAKMVAPQIFLSAGPPCVACGKCTELKPCSSPRRIGPKGELI